MADKLTRLMVNKITVVARRRWGWAEFLVRDATGGLETNGEVSSIAVFDASSNTDSSSLARNLCLFVSF